MFVLNVSSAILSVSREVLVFDFAEASCVKWDVVGYGHAVVYVQKKLKVAWKFSSFILLFNLSFNFCFKPSFCVLQQFSLNEKFVKLHGIT